MQIILTEKEYEELKFKAKKWDEQAARDKYEPNGGWAVAIDSYDPIQSKYKCPFCDLKITVTDKTKSIINCPSCMRQLRLK